MTTIWNLFLTFLKIGLLSIGGGYAIIPLIQEQVVDRAGWISERMFTDIITISQMTPGPFTNDTGTIGRQYFYFCGPSNQRNQRRHCRHIGMYTLRGNYLFIFVPFFSKTSELNLYI